MNADRAEVARFIRRMADLYESGELHSFEWCQRLERVYDPQPFWNTRYYYDSGNGKLEHHDEPLYHLDYSRVNNRDGWHYRDDDGHPFVEAVELIKTKVVQAHSHYWNTIHQREQEYRMATLLLDWYGTEEVEGAEPDLFGAKERRRRMTQKAAARRYGHGVQKAKKDAEGMMSEAPKDGPQRYRWLKERGL